MHMLCIFTGNYRYLYASKLKIIIREQQSYNGKPTQYDLVLENCNKSRSPTRYIYMLCISFYINIFVRPNEIFWYSLQMVMLNGWYASICNHYLFSQVKYIITL